MPAGGPAGDQDPQPAPGIRASWPRLEASAEPIWTIGPSRPTDPPAPMHSAEASALTTLTCGRIRPPFSSHGDHHLGHAVPAGLAGEPVDQRAVEQPAGDRDQSTKNPRPSHGR